MNKDRIKAAVLEQVRAAAGSEGPVVAVDLPLGGSGYAADLAILDGEFIGIVIADASDLPDLPRRLETTSRFFERVVLVAAPDHLPRLEPKALSGATVWTHDGEGRLAEHHPGTGNRVGLHARFDLLRLDERRYFLGELVTVDGVRPREPLTVPPTRMQALFGMVFTARHGRASAAFWAATADRPIAPDDPAMLGRQGGQRDGTGGERRRAA